jgi:sugar-specific transcriptional regulator TrmB
VNRDEWVQKLKKMGLSGYEAQVYLALLGETRAPASRIVRKSGVPQSKVYGALTALVQKGFAEQVLGDVKLFRGIPPAEAFANYQRSVHESLLSAQSDMDELSRSAPSSPGQEPGSLGIRLVRAQQIKAVLAESYGKATTELLVAIKNPALVSPDLQRDMRGGDRNVRMRYIVEAPILRNPQIGPALRAEADESDTVRFIERVPLHFMVVDRRIVIMELPEEDGTTLALVVPNRGLAENMRRLFDTLWGQGQSAGEMSDHFRSAVVIN